MSRRGCCCPLGKCLVCGDDFDRAASTNLGSDWGERSGDWEIIVDDVGPPIFGHLDENGTAGALAICQTETRRKQQTADVAILNLLDGDKPRLAFNYLDDSNYFFIEMENAGAIVTVRFYRRASGSNSLLRSDTTGALDETRANVKVCVSRTSITWECTDVAGPIYLYECDPQLHTGGKKAGLGNGGTTAVHFDDFTLQNYHGNDGPADDVCCRQQCHCEEGGVKHCISHTLTATVAATGGCADLDGETFSITYDEGESAWVSSGDEPFPCENSEWAMACGASECSEITPEPAFSMTNKWSSAGCTEPDACIDYDKPSISVQCNPLVIVFGVKTESIHEPPTSDCSCCDETKVSTIQITVTE